MGGWLAGHSNVEPAAIPNAEGLVFVTVRVRWPSCVVVETVVVTLPRPDHTAEM